MIPVIHTSMVKFKYLMYLGVQSAFKISLFLGSFTTPPKNHYKFLGASIQRYQK